MDAVVLAGGRSARLGRVPKAGLVVGGRTLLERTLDAASAARSTVVVGDRDVIAAAAPGRRIEVVREEPAFGGPAAGIATGVTRLDDGAEAVLVLACDMPRVAEVVEALLAAGVPGGAADDGRRQSLAALYPVHALRAAVGSRSSWADRSVRELVGGIEVPSVAVPPGSTADVDTWDDADALGVEERMPR